MTEAQLVVIKELFRHSKHYKDIYVDKSEDGPTLWLPLISKDGNVIFKFQLKYYVLPDPYQQRVIMTYRDSTVEFVSIDMSYTAYLDHFDEGVERFLLGILSHSGRLEAYARQQAQNVFKLEKDLNLNLKKR